MRPTVEVFSDDLIDRVVDEATDILCALGVEASRHCREDLLEKPE